MRTSERAIKIAWGGLILASSFALVCLVLLLLGAVGGGVWFTFAAMVLLALSHATALIRDRRQRLRD
jgi:CHASE2 domain-containing sensor protein